MPSFQLHAPSTVLLLYLSEQWPCDIVVFLFGCCLLHACLVNTTQNASLKACLLVA